MEIKRIDGVINSYNTQKLGKARKSTASSPVKSNTDRVEFGFEKALQAAKNGIAAQVKADASAQELSAAKETAEQGVPAGELAGYILLG